MIHAVETQHTCFIYTVENYVKWHNKPKVVKNLADLPFILGNRARVGVGKYSESDREILKRK